MPKNTSRFSIVKPHPQPLCLVVWAVVLAIACLAGPAPAADFTWTSATTGGLWSGTTNWNPAGSPGASDSATLGNVTSGTRRVDYDSLASGTLATLALTQTAAAVNELGVQQSVTITNAVTLGASGGGTARLFLDPQGGSANITGTFSAGITLNAGGELRLGVVNPSGGTVTYRGDVTGNVTVAGGSLVVAPIVRQGTVTGATQNTLTGNLTMSSGTLLLDNVNATNQSDRRLKVTGTVDITGGSITTNTGSPQAPNLLFGGSSITFNPTSFAASQIAIQLDGGTQSFAAGVAIGDITVRGTGTKTVSNTAAGGNIGHILISDGSNTAAGTTVKLGSNLTLTSGRLMPAAASVGQSPQSGRIDLGIDADVYTLDLTSAAGRWTPDFKGSNVTSALWTVSGSGGKIVANGYNFAGSGVTVNVGAGLTLESRAGNGVANDLGAGTIDATSTFLYAGTAATGTPATLTAGGTIGNLTVASGALQLGTLGGIAGTLAFTGSTGRLDVGAASRTVAGLTTPNGVNAALAVVGSGLVVNSGSEPLQIGPGGTVTSPAAVALDLSGLSTFTHTGGLFRVGLKAGSGNSGPLGQVATATLAATNSITAARILVGDVAANNDGGISTLELGQANTLNADEVAVATSGRSDATVRFRAGLTNPTATLRGLDGVSSMTEWYVGNAVTFNGANQTEFSATVDLSAGSVDALVDHLIVGSASIGTATGRAGQMVSTFTVGSGTLAAGTITLGRIAGGATSSVTGTLAANGTLTLANAGGTVIADTITIAENTYLGSTAAARTVSGTINLTAGTLAATSIALGLQTGNATATTDFNWTGGTLTHKAETDLVVASVPIALASGTGTFHATTSRTITVDAASPISGGGGLTKTGPGTLLLSAANSYAGETTISAGTLLVNGSLANTSAVTVAAGGTLGGSGSIGAALAGAGLISPGNSPGILTAPAVTPSAGTGFAFEFTGTGSPAYGNPTASINDVLRLTDPTTPFTTPLTGTNVIDVYFDVTALTNGDVFRGGFYTDLGTDFLPSIADATYAYWVRGDGFGGDRSFGGQSFYSLASFNSGFSVTLSTVAESANFGTGPIDGQATQFVIVPEPGLALATAALVGIGIAARRRTRR